MRLSQMIHTSANQVLIRQIYSKGNMLYYIKYPQVENCLSRDNKLQNTYQNLLHRVRGQYNPNFVIYRLTLSVTLRRRSHFFSDPLPVF